MNSTRIRSKNCTIHIQSTYKSRKFRSTNCTIQIKTLSHLPNISQAYEKWTLLVIVFQFHNNHCEITNLPPLRHVRRQKRKMTMVRKTTTMVKSERPRRLIGRLEKVEESPRSNRDREGDWEWERQRHWEWERQRHWEGDSERVGELEWDVARLREWEGDSESEGWKFKLWVIGVLRV